MGDEQHGQAEVRCRSWSRLSTCAWTETSRAETGSSATMKSGSTASARAMPMRWRWPPENSCGKRRVVRVEPDPIEQLADPLAAAARGEAVGVQRLAEDLGHAHARVEAGIRILEDDLHPPALGAQGAVRQGA